MATNSATRRRRRLALALFAVGIVVIVIGLSYHPTDFLSVDDVMRSPDTYIGKDIEVKGEVKSDSLSTDGGNLTFILSGKEHELTVVYNKAAPDGLVEGKDVVVKGTLRDDLVLVAGEIQIGCPSHYSSAEGA